MKTISDLINPESNQEKEDIRADMMSLVNQPGWNRIVGAMDEGIRLMNKAIDERKFESVADFELVRMKRNMYEQFRNLPEILIGITELNDTIEPTLDPYH